MWAYPYYYIVNGLVYRWKFQLQKFFTLITHTSPQEEDAQAMALDNFFNRMGGVRTELESTTEVDIDGMVYVLPPDFNKGDFYYRFLNNYFVDARFYCKSIQSCNEKQCNCTVPRSVATGRP